MELKRLYGVIILVIWEVVSEQDPLEGLGVSDLQVAVLKSNDDEVLVVGRAVETGDQSGFPFQVRARYGLFYHAVILSAEFSLGGYCTYPTVLRIAHLVLLTVVVPPN